MAEAEERQDQSPIIPRTLPRIFWGVIIFLSAFLLFEVQPILAKTILPWFGGMAGVWTVSLMFFQITYLLGNLYAHWLVHAADSKAKIWTHIFLLTASLLLLPIVPRDFWKPVGGADPTFRILGLLTVTIGLPFVLLSATSPLLQTWYTRERSGGRPYRFYALSNAGSLLALLSYPVLIEPNLGTHHQLVSWSVVYAAFVVLGGLIALRRTSLRMTSGGVESSTRPSWKLQLLWIALAADASILLLAITTYISQNVAAVPLLWILPLSLYLLSMILCFEGGNWYRRFLYLRFAAVAIGGMTLALSPDFANAGPLLQIPLYCAGLFICCMACHGELARLKPEHGHLTLFYLMVSIGGALGGVFVGVIAPFTFRGFFELPIGIVGCAILLWIALHRDPSTVFYGAWLRPPSLVFTAMVLLLVVSSVDVASRQSEQTLLMVRNFYGILRVRDDARTELEPRRRELLNGTILHGVEIMENGRRDDATTYYSPESGVGLALRAAMQRGSVHVGVIGLGIGTIATYGRPGDQYTFYEINPLVIGMAHSEFHFLGDSSAQIEILPGDARLTLERQPPQGFNVLVVDAFSGDAIPVHLLTLEAFQLYFRELAPAGILAVHVSNRFLDLAPVVEAAARSLGVFSKVIVNQSDKKREVSSATWVLLSKDEHVLADPTFPAVNFFTNRPQFLRPWTDDWSNLLKILK